MMLSGARRPRIVAPRCLRCRRPLSSGSEHGTAAAYCTECHRRDGWLEPWEADDA